MSEAKENLFIIKNIKFTSREVDIISAILNNRGEKKIANLLDISPRTVSSHVHNIMLKINQNSKDGIIDFIQDSGKIAEFNNHYNHIIIQDSFKNYLLKIKKEIIGQDVTISIADSKVLEKFSVDLLVAGIAFRIDANNPDLYMDYLKGLDGEDYYSKVFGLITKITGNQSIKSLSNKFKAEYAILKQYSVSSATNLKPKKPYIKILFIISALILAFFISYKLFKKDTIIARSNLMVPNKDIIIERKHLIKKLDNILSDRNKIAIALIAGTEGTGKTILARIYAKDQNRPIIWEVDASNETNMLASFEKLAFFLAENKEDREEIESIEKVANTESKIKKLENFLSKKSRKYPNWLIIYDNVPSFSSVSKYFPHDNKVWGNGSVIITTRNLDIDSNDYFSHENIMRIGELNTEEKTQLFSNVVKPRSIANDQYCKKLIDNIPPYPLDVLHVANFIKKEKISCENYLGYLKQNLNASIDIDSNYLEARNKIIYRSLDQILKINPEFLTLLIITSSIANQNIPKDLLDFASNKDASSRFINEMQKFAFIDKKNSDSNNFSIHHSIQTIAKSYVKSLIPYKSTIMEVTQILNDYFTLSLDENSIDETKSTIPHIEAFLGNIDIIHTKAIAELYIKLGNCFFDVASYKKSEVYYQNAEIIYQKYYTKFHPKIAHLYLRLGILHRNIGNYIEAKNYLEKALESQIKIYTPNNEKLAKTYIYLGSIYMELRDFQNALNYTQKGINILKSLDDPCEIEMTKANAYLAAIYTNLERYDIARPMLEKALSDYQKYYHDNHSKTAWVKTILAIVYYKIGMLEESMNLVNQARETYRDSCGENSIEFAWTTIHLGIIYNKLGKYNEANALINTSIIIYKKYFKEDHKTMIWAKNQLKKT